MSRYIDDMPFEEMAEMYSKGKILLGVEPSLARRFIMDFGENDKLNYLLSQFLMTKESYIVLRRLKIILNVFLILAYLTLVIFFISSIILYGLWGILIGIIASIIFLLYSSYASLGKQTIRRVIFCTILCFIVAFDTKSISESLFFFTMPLPFLFIRLIYYISVNKIRNLALKDENLYNSILNKIIFVKED